MIIAIQTPLNGSICQDIANTSHGIKQALGMLRESRSGKVFGPRFYRGSNGELLAEHRVTDYFVMPHKVWQEGTKTFMLNAQRELERV